MDIPDLAGKTIAYLIFLSVITLIVAMNTVAWVRILEWWGSC